MNDNPQVIAQATPTLPAGTFRPKQSLGQNFLRDGNTVAKIVRAFVSDAQHGNNNNKGNEVRGGMRAVELGPGAGALTDVLVPTLLKTDGGSINDFRCIEIDSRSVELLRSKHPNLEVIHRDVLMIDYRTLAEEGSYRDVDKINDEDDANSA
jgi:16S rRNA A1518/A1519 N6-dimethyltransferase RsmA/KsgA/DIM1 with predicted DNA glycosylase/AP lyase activity